MYSGLTISNKIWVVFNAFRSFDFVDRFSSEYVALSRVVGRFSDGIVALSWVNYGFVDQKVRQRYAAGCERRLAATP